jgi:glycogen synthase
MKLTSTWALVLLAIAALTEVCHSYNPSPLILTLHLVAFWEDVGLTFLAEVEAPFAEFFFGWFHLEVFEYWLIFFKKKGD